MSRATELKEWQRRHPIPKDARKWPRVGGVVRCFTCDGTRFVGEDYCPKCQGRGLL